MQFRLIVNDVAEFDRSSAEFIAKELAIVLENEGYTVEVYPMADEGKGG